MISSIVSRASALVLACAGVGLLFVPDVFLNALVPAYPAPAQWIGQLLGGAWLSIAALNWSQRTAIIGGIYARPLVYTNFVMWLVSALTLVRQLRATQVTTAAWAMAAVAVVFAAAYAALLFRGPFDALKSTDSAT
jgi:hypothetical protein